MLVQKLGRHGRKLAILLLVGGWISAASPLVFARQPPVASGLGAGPEVETQAAGVGLYIVLFKESAFSLSARSAGRLDDEVATLTRSLAQRYGAIVKAQWSHAVTGMAVEMDEQAAAALANDPRVRLVEEDGPVSKKGVQSPVSWGLDRVDQRDLPLNNTYAYANDGEGVTAYIIDTGIRVTHTEFSGRTSWGANFVDTINSDCDGHGTHVAGIVGGMTYGIAKNVTLVAVKVLDCEGDGTTSTVLSGIDWMIANKRLPAVANLSLGGSYSVSLNQAVAQATSAGISVVVAAGNESQNACDTSPASAPEAITVGATSRDDGRAWFSNIGPCLDLFAPGDAIPSAYWTSDTATVTGSGTSQAAPHVAGAAALYLKAVPTGSPSAVAAALLNNATVGRVVNPGVGSPNLLLFTGTVAPGLARLSVAKSGGGSGRVTSSPSGIDCGPSCAADFAVGAAITLTAAPEPGSTFDGWSGDCTGTGVCRVTMSQARLVAAAFSSAVARQYRLSVAKTGDGSGLVTSNPFGINCGSSCSADFSAGASVALSATPAPGSSFTGWSGACAGTGPCEVAMTQGRSVAAGFAAGAYRITTVANPPGSGTVTCTPNPVVHGGSSTCAARAASSYRFGSWAGDCAGNSQGACTLSGVTGPKTVIGVFVESEPGDDDAALPSRGGWRAILEP